MAKEPNTKKDKSSFKDAYSNGYQKLTPHTKNGDTLGDATSQWLISNWSVIPSVLLLIVMGVIAINTQSKIQTRTEQISKLELKINGLQDTLSNAKNGGSEKIVKKTIDVKMNSAKDAGSKMIELQTKLMSSLDYTLAENGRLPEPSVIKATIDEIKAMTGFTSSEAYATWIKVPSWTMEFKSVASYENADIPVLFMMKDGNGQLMGMVTATYHSDSNRFSDINVTYTTAGEAVSYNRGGA